MTLNLIIIIFIACESPDDIVMAVSSWKISVTVHALMEEKKD